MRSRKNNTTLTRKVDKWNTRKVWLIKRYAAKSATEKISRNRHGLDADGNPISGAGVGEYTTTTTSDKEAKG